MYFFRVFDNLYLVEVFAYFSFSIYCDFSIVWRSLFSFLYLERVFLTFIRGICTYFVEELLGLLAVVDFYVLLALSDRF